MQIAIHRNSGYCNSFAEEWARCLAEREVDTRWVNLTAQNALQQLEGCDGVMWRWGRLPRKAYQILNVVERFLKIPVFPSYETSWHYDEKLLQHYQLQAVGVPTPKTWVFWDQQKAKEWALQADYPKVFKLSSGNASRTVSLVSSIEEARQLIDRMFGEGIPTSGIDRPAKGVNPRDWKPSELLRRSKSAARHIVPWRRQMLRKRPEVVEHGYAYFQEFVPDNDYVTDIVVAGNRVFGYLDLNGSKGPTDIRAKSGKEFDPAKIDLRLVATAFEISDRLGFQFMFYEFMMRDGEPVVIELSHANDFSVAKCPGHWNRNLEWVSGRVSAQEAQVETFLDQIANRRSPTGPLHHVESPLP